MRCGPSKPVAFRGIGHIRIGARVDQNVPALAPQRQRERIRMAVPRATGAERTAVKGEMRSRSPENRQAARGKMFALVIPLVIGNGRLPKPPDRLLGKILTSCLELFCRKQRRARGKRRACKTPSFSVGVKKPSAVVVSNKRKSPTAIQQGAQASSHSLERVR